MTEPVNREVAMRRDPRIDPQEGDVLYQANGTRELHVEKVDAEEVCYRVTDGDGGLLASYRTPLANWRESAPYTCDESEMFCPTCETCVYWAPLESQEEGYCRTVSNDDPRIESYLNYVKNVSGHECEMLTKKDYICGNHKG